MPDMLEKMAGNHPAKQFNGGRLFYYKLVWFWIHPFGGVAFQSFQIYSDPKALRRTREMSQDEGKVLSARHVALLSRGLQDISICWFSDVSKSLSRLSERSCDQISLNFGWISARHLLSTWKKRHISLTDFGRFVDGHFHISIYGILDFNVLDFLLTVLVWMVWMVLLMWRCTGVRIIFNEPITAKRVEKVGWFFVRAEIVYQDRMCIVAQLKQGIGI